MELESKVKSPVGKVEIIIEQDKITKCPKQQACLTYFALELADRIFNKGKREPIPQPQLIVSGPMWYYSVGLIGNTKLNFSDLDKYLNANVLNAPYTQIMLHADDLGKKYVPKQA